MNIIVFDTETNSINKPFCYNVGYLVANTDTGETIIKRDFVIEQVWHNTMMFETAYYADKKPIYIKAMRARKTILEKWGYVMQQMSRDIKTFEVTKAFAFNSPFDDRVFSFNAEWFRTHNPLENVEVVDIRAFAFKYLASDRYKLFCEEHELFTDGGNYQTSAESFYRFITKDADFNEAHTALADSEIEWEVLNACLLNGADINEDIGNAPKLLNREVSKVFTVKKDGKTIFTTDCVSITYCKASDSVRLKG